MTTPERSVEEIVEEYYTLHCHTVQGVPMHSTQTALGEIDWLRQTLQAERQKREDERKDIIHHWNKAEQRLDGTAQGAVNAIEQFRNYLTQPNNK